MTFLEPIFLFLLAPWVALFLLWLIIAVMKIRSRPQETYGSKYPLVGRVKLWGFALISLVLMILALAKPVIPETAIKPTRENIEIILVVDRSISMRADDVKESRLEIAKREAAGIMPLLVEGDKLALFVFGSNSNRKIYLTERFDVTFDRLARINFRPTSDLDDDNTVWDSDFATMLESIYQSMDRQDGFNEGDLKKYQPKKRSNRIVIIFSDGEDQYRKDSSLKSDERRNYVKRLEGALAEFRKRGLNIYPVGIGTARGVSWLSLLRGYKSVIDYPHYLVEEWAGKLSRIDRENLMFLASSTEVTLAGHVWTVENRTTTVKIYLDDLINSNRSVLFEVREDDNGQGLWQYFLVVAISILFLGILTYPISGYLKNRKR